MKNPNEVLFAGRVLDGRDEQHPKVTLKDETVVIVRVCTVPARSHIAILDLFHEGKEADLIQRCVEQCVKLPESENGSRSAQCSSIISPSKVTCC